MGTAQTRGQQGRQYDQEELEARLRDALARLMVDGLNFRDLSVARIIEAARVARSTFYTYYDDKDSMVMSLGSHSLARLYQGQRGWIAKGADATQADIAAGMRQLVDDFARDEVILAVVTEAAVYDIRVRASYL